MKKTLAIAKLVIFSVITVLAGCIPVGGSFLRLTYDGATYLDESCYGTVGAPRIALFPFNGIYLSAAIYERFNTVIIGIHIPDGQSAQILSKNIEVNSQYIYDKKSVMVEIRPHDHYEFSGNMPYIFNYPDTFGKEDFFGVLSGGTMEITFKVLGTPQTAYKWYAFSAKVDLGQATAGMIRFPPLKVNGVEFQGPVLPFTKEHYFEISGMNC